MRTKTKTNNNNKISKSARVKNAFEQANNHLIQHKVLNMTPEELAKLKQRQSRFGGATESPALQSIEAIEKLKQRQARFGATESSALKSVEELEKINQRKARFGDVTTPVATKEEAPSAEEAEKRKLRAAKFQQQASATA